METDESQESKINHFVEITELPDQHSIPAPSSPFEKFNDCNLSLPLGGTTFPESEKPTSELTESSLSYQHSFLSSQPHIISQNNFSSADLDTNLSHFTHHPILLSGPDSLFSLQRRTHSLYSTRPRQNMREMDLQSVNRSLSFGMRGVREMREGNISHQSRAIGGVIRTNIDEHIKLLNEHKKSIMKLNENVSM